MACLMPVWMCDRAALTVTQYCKLMIF